MLWGTTYSHRHAAYLHLDPIKAFQTLLTLKFDIMRLGCYWDEIEQEQGKYNFSSIKTYLDLCSAANQPVVLSIGMKAPRWPEFYFPKWAKKRSFDELSPLVCDLIEQTVTTLSDYDCIAYWQVENEPLDPSGPNNLAIPFSLLEEEVKLVRSFDPFRPVIINLWGNELSRRNLTKDAAQLGDIIGIDVYYKQFLTQKLSHNFYCGPRDSERKMEMCVKNADKPLWITELQAEPWEVNHTTYLSDNPKSINPELLEDNVQRARMMNPQALLLWGSEYWLWKKSQGDEDLWNTVDKILQQSL